MTCYAESCKQICYVSGCGLECHGKSCQQECPKGNCRLKCPENAEKCDQECGSPFPFPFKKSMCTKEYLQPSTTVAPTTEAATTEPTTTEAPTTAAPFVPDECERVEDGVCYQACTKGNCEMECYNSEYYHSCEQSCTGNSLLLLKRFGSNFWVCGWNPALNSGFHSMKRLGVYRYSPWMGC